MSEVIIFEGVHVRNKIPHLVFRVRRNINERVVEIPVDHVVAEHVMLHLSKAAPPTPPKPVERGNDEESL